jgi:hypothetical protein
LIGSALLSLLIPLINIDYNKASHISGAETIYPFINQINDFQIGIQHSISQESSILQISISDVIHWIYMAGFFVMALKLFSGLFKLFGIINKSPKLKDQDHTLLISEDVPAASFFSYIFWKDKHDKSDPIQKTIMDHEMVHVRQWHSLDVVIMEIMVIIKWFNPLVYLFRNSLKKTHEFIADKYVTDQMGDKLTYASILIANSASNKVPPISNHFYGNIKERIQMLGMKQSAHIQKIKYLTIIPLTLILFSLFSFDLSDQLPQPIKSSFQNIENSVLAIIEKNVVSLNLDEEKEKEAFHLDWSDIMKLKIVQTNKIQDFLFYYSKTNLNLLLSGSPTITQNGQSVKVYIDSLEIMTNSGKKHININSLKDKLFRNFLIDSLEKYDQITLGLKSYSDTDSLYIKLHIGLDQESFQDVSYNNLVDDKTLRWGQRKILFNSTLIVDGSRVNFDEYATNDELMNMLENKLEYSLNSTKYMPFPENMTISFNVKRVNKSRLAQVDSDLINKSLRDNGTANNVIAIKSHYNGKSYSLLEESKSYSLKEFYKQKKEFKNWMSNFENGDNIRIKIEGSDKGIGNYDFNLRYRDDNEALTAPFPVELPHTTDAYSNYQVIMHGQGKSYIRIDTKAIENQSIIDAYKDSKSYEIIHIDDFKTKNRVYESNLPEGNLKIESAYNPYISHLNLLSLNDYYSDEDELVRMDWGKMVSMPNIGNYSIKEFKRSSKQKLVLFTGTKNIKMARFDLLIIPENGKIQRLRIENINTQSIKETLSKVNANTSIYIDNIIVDVDDELKFYPYNFVFTVE